MIEYGSGASSTFIFGSCPGGPPYTLLFVPVDDPSPSLSVYEIDVNSTVTFGADSVNMLYPANSNFVIVVGPFK